MSQNYAALIIDLKKSREYTKEDRNYIQHYIMDVIHLLNNLYRKELIREVDFSAGDEVQGLFSSPEFMYLAALTTVGRRKNLPLVVLSES